MDDDPNLVPRFVDFDACRDRLEKALDAARHRRGRMERAAQEAVGARRVLLNSLCDLDARTGGPLGVDLIRGEQRLLQVLERSLHDVDDDSLRLVLRIYGKEEVADP